MVKVSDYTTSVTVLRFLDLTLVSLSACGARGVVSHNSSNVETMEESRSIAIVSVEHPQAFASAPVMQ